MNVAKQKAENQPALITYPGDRYAICVGHRVGFAGTDDHHSATTLLELLETHVRDPWEALVRGAAKMITTAGYNHHGFVLVEPRSTATLAFIFGDAGVTVHTNAEQHRANGSNVSTWIETQFPGQPESITFGACDGTPNGDIRHGINQAGGAQVHWVPTITSGAGAGQQPESAQDRSTDPEPAAVPRQEPPLILEVAAEGAVDFDSTQHVDPAVLKQIREEAARMRAAETLPPTSFTAPTTADEPTVALPDAVATPPPVSSSAMATGARTPEPPQEPKNSTDDFDPNVTHSITGEQLRQTVHAAVAATDSRRHSEANATEEAGFTKPILKGILCPNGHLNSMQDAQCRACGVDLDRTAAITNGPRPVLAILTLDDGSQVPLDQPVVFGRDLPGHYTIGGEQARIIEISDEKSMISRVHLEIHLASWDIELIDQGSSNGTFTRPLDAIGARTRLRAGYPTAIQLPIAVELGQRSFTLSAGPMN